MSLEITMTENDWVIHPFLERLSVPSPVEIPEPLPQEIYLFQRVKGVFLGQPASGYEKRHPGWDGASS